jgi:hypothetical protein
MYEIIKQAAQTTATQVKRKASRLMPTPEPDSHHKPHLASTADSGVLSEEAESDV